MKDVRVRKDELVSVLTKNRAEHQKIFDEALSGYRDKVIAKLEDALVKARRGERVLEHLVIPQPVNQTHEYNRALRMLEMSVDEEITLTVQEFEQYVMDRWMWKQSFLMSNSAYSATAARTMQDEGDDA